MCLVIVLPRRNQDQLEKPLQGLYDPSRPSYRHFLKVEEFTARFGPTQEDYDAVIRFAEANGLTVAGKSRNRVNLDVIGSVSNIEQAFHLRSISIPPRAAHSFAPDREPTPDLAVPLWHIAGLDNYSIPRPAIVHRNAAGGRIKCDHRFRSRCFLPG